MAHIPMKVAASIGYVYRDVGKVWNVMSSLLQFGQVFEAPYAIYLYMILSY